MIGLIGLIGVYKLLGKKSRNPITADEFYQVFVMFGYGFSFRPGLQCNELDHSADRDQRYDLSITGESWHC